MFGCLIMYSLSIVSSRFFIFLAFIFLCVFLYNLNHVQYGALSRYLWITISLIGVFLISKIKLKKSAFWFLTLYLFFLIYASLIISSSSGSLTRVIPYATFLIICFSTYLTISFLLKRLAIKDIAFITLATYLLQAFTVFAFFINPEFKNWVLSSFSDNGNIDYTASVRAKGISGGGSTISFFFFFGVLYCFYLINQSSRKFHKLVSYIAIPIFFVAMLLTGRTGLLFLLISFFIVFCFQSFNILFNLRLNKKTLKLVFLFSFISTIVVTFLYFSYLKVGGVSTHFGGDALSSILSWVSKESTGDSTVIVLLSNHLTVNPDLTGLIFGDPNYLLSAKNHTDIGYLRILNDFGLIGFILYYSSIFILLYGLASNISDRYVKHLAYIMLFILFIAEFKEPYMFKHLIVSSYLFFFFLFGLYYEKNNPHYHWS